MANPSNSTSAAQLAGYETTFITRSEMTDEALKALTERLGGVVTSFQGETVLSEDWGKRKLAYPISKETRGHYTYLVYTGKGDVVHEMERTLRLQDHVLRFLTVNLEKEFNAESFRKRRAEVHAAAKRREEEREARREERMAERRAHGYGDSHHEDRGDYRRHDAVEESATAGDTGSEE